MRMLSADQLLSLINALGGIVWEADPETFQFLFVSEEAERILGYPVRELARRAGLLAAPHPSGRRRALHGVLPRGDAAGRGSRVRIPDDCRRRPDRVAARHRHGAADAGRRTGAWSASPSTSPPRRSRRRTSAGSSELYEALVENSSDNISLLRRGRRSRSTRARRSAASSDTRPSEVVGRNNFDLVHPGRRRR